MNNSAEMTPNKSIFSKDPVEIERVIQITPSQMEIWLACKLGGKEANMAYNESVSIDLTGNLSVKTLQAAFWEIIARHDGMRAIISPNGKHLMVLSSYELPIRLRDISEMSAEDKDKFLKKHRAETGNYQLNLTQGPLYVMELIKLDSMHHQLTFTGHHIIFDGWSLGVLLEELSSLYSSILNGTESKLEKADELSLYSKDLIEFTRKSSYKATKNFWTQSLSNPVPDVKLPLDKQRPKIRTYSCDLVEVPFEDSILARTVEYSIRQKVSLNHTLLTIFELFLSDWTRQTDIVVGLAVAGQLLMNRPSLIGHCVHVLPLRSQINTNQTFAEYLQVRRRYYNETLDHQAISFGSMIQDLQIKRDPARIPLVPMAFNIDKGMDTLVSFSGLDHKLISNPKSFSNVEILVNLARSANENIFEWTFQKDLFEKETIEAAGERYLTFIERILQNPDIRLSDLIDCSIQAIESSAVASSEHVEDLIDFVPISELMLANFEKLGDQHALSFEEQTFSYQALGKKVKSFAGFLIQNGVGPGDIVGVNLERSSELIIVIQGIIQTGAAYLPIDLDFPEERVKFMLEDTNIKFFFSDRRDINWGELESKKLNLTPEVYTDFLREFHPKSAKAEDPIFIIYTSGSTGMPKGVVLTQYNLFHLSSNHSIEPGMKMGDRVIGLTSVSFDMHWVDLVMPFAYGASVFLLNRYHRIDAREIVKSLERDKITILAATPSHFRSLMNHGMTKKFGGLNIITGGEPLLVGLADSLLQVSDSVYNQYGPSETTLYATQKKVLPGTQLITIGKPLPGTSILIVGEDGSLINESGKVGEILIGGTGVAKGYLNRPDLNLEKFIEVPFPATHRRNYKTGDLGHWTEDGEIVCLGRIDHQVKIRGQRVELGEIESKIALDEKVQSVAVLKFVEENGDDLLRAFVSIKESYKSVFDAQSWIEECKDNLGDQLASYMVPGHFVVLDQLPVNSNGKIDRNELKSTFATASESRPTPTEIIIPVELSGTESRVKVLWEKMLQIQNANPDGDFFEMGGHSLLAVDLISQLEKEFDLNLPLSILFEFSSISSISAQINKLLGENRKSYSGSLVKIKDGDPEKTLFFVHGVGLNPIEINTLIQNMGENQTIWGLQSPAIVDSSIQPMTNLEDIAAYYINEIKMAGLSGPYNLMGNSFGGLIAFEMANQLTKQGEKVSFLGMIDTTAYMHEGNNDTVLSGIKTVIDKLIFEAKFIFDDLGYYLNFRLKYVKEKWRNLMDKFSKPDETSLYSRIKHIERVNVEAWSSYSHPTIDVKITIFLAEKKTFYVQDPKTFGWGPLASKVETLTMPGDHAEMLKPPHGEKFSKSLQSLLDTLN